MFQALIFDLDNTLLDRPAAQRHWSERLVDRWLPEATTEAKADAVENLFALDDLGYIPREEFGEGVLERFPDWQPEGGLDSDADSRVAALLVEFRRELISLYPPARGHLRPYGATATEILSARRDFERPRLQSVAEDAASGTRCRV